MHLLCALDARSQRDTRYPATTTASATTTATATIAVGRVERFCGCGGWGTATTAAAAAIVPLVCVPIVSSFRNTLSADCGRSSGRFSRRPHDQRREPRWNPRPLNLDRFWLLGGVRGKERDRATPGERMRASQDLIRHHAERVEVRSVIDRRVDRDLLGRHVRRCADRNTDRRQRLALHRTTTRRTVVSLSFGTLERFRDAEIGDRCRFAGDENVFGLEVAIRTMPCACAKASARVTSRMIEMASAMGSLPTRSIGERKDSPST